MSQQTPQAESRITLAAVQELDRLARQFRRRLRDLAVESSCGAGNLGPLGPDDILKALPLAVRELAAGSGCKPDNESSLHGQDREAA
jgi:hypothetical protein